MKVNKRHQVSPYFAFFLIYNSQVGVGILSFQRTIAEKAGYDAWISVIIAGCLVQIFLWIMYKLLIKQDGDIIDIHTSTFGNTLGKFLSAGIIFYYWMASLSVLTEYIEIIHVWMFPTLPSWVISSLLLLLVYYCVSGGFRAVVGLSFLSFVFPQVLITFLYIFPLKTAHFSNLLPIMNHSLTEMADSLKSSMYTMAGTEALLMYYPFIRNPEASRKYAHLGVLFTTVLYTISAVVSFTFYSENQLKTTLWPELSLIKITKLSYLERFEYLYISMYAIIVTSLIALFLWCSARGFKKLFHIKQPYILLFLLVASGGITQFITEDLKNLLDNFIIYMNLYIFYLYIPILLLLFTFLKRGKKHG
ncbi:GerAB/ArcD/ProY family transporter [Metabacillus idriensis]|uniref:GerAB/ArcD/ProY family transporter n=1 Tax=Metabacillus idriensis TaxID=324768 RepID=UPI0028136C29|nr:GerAB/ArcD/ProY family transporter [Metabacillus idriensis]MDR0140099.1 GerAB/ArcD/ProY family transporter [Metabacillus idriensis]